MPAIPVTMSSASLPSAQQQLKNMQKIIPLLFILLSICCSWHSQHMLLYSLLCSYMLAGQCKSRATCAMYLLTYTVSALGANRGPTDNQSKTVTAETNNDLTCCTSWSCALEQISQRAFRVRGLNRPLLVSCPTTSSKALSSPAATLAYAAQLFTQIGRDAARGVWADARDVV